MQDDKEFLQQVNKRRNRKHKRKRFSFKNYARNMEIARILNDYFKEDD